MDQTSHVLGFPAYALRSYGTNCMVVGGGGGTMKSGVPNEMVCLSVDVNGSFEVLGKTEVEDAVMSLDISKKSNEIAAIVGQTMKKYVVKDDGAGVSKLSDELMKSEEVPVVTFPQGSEVSRFQGHKQSVMDFDSSADGKIVVSTSRDKSFIWDSSFGKEIAEIKAKSPKAHIRNIQIEPKFGLILAVENEHRVGSFLSVYKADGAKVSTTKIMNEQVTAMAISPGSMIGFGGSEGNVAAGRLDEQGRISMTFKTRSPVHILAVTSLIFTDPDGTLVTVSADSTMKSFPAKLVDREPAVTIAIALLLIFLVLSFSSGVIVPYRFDYI